MRVPYHLLQLSTRCPSKKLDLNIYYLKIISRLKQVEGVAVPLDQCRINTRQPVWNIHPEFKQIKIKQRFGSEFR